MWQSFEIGTPLVLIFEKKTLTHVLAQGVMALAKLGLVIWTSLLVHYNLFLFVLTGVWLVKLDSAFP